MKKCDFCTMSAQNGGCFGVCKGIEKAIVEKP